MLLIEVAYMSISVQVVNFTIMEESFGIEDVVARGLCVGCGGCAIRTSGKISIELGRYGMHQAQLGNASAADLTSASRVCPMSDHSVNETRLAQERFPHLPEDPLIGKHQSIFAGRVTDDDKLKKSSSGGLTSFLLERLLSQGEIDGVIHVGRESGSSLFSYSVSRNVHDLLEKRKSNYYSTTLAGAINEVLGDGKRYAIVGIPCFIKAMRLVVREQPELEPQFPYFVGLLCGHLKTQYFAESLGWQAGISPKELASIDFRVKDPNSSSNEYLYAAASRNQITPQVRPMRGTLDGNWGYAAFQPEACNFCDDVFAETADVVLGDAWLPEYTNDWRGTNVVVSRNKMISQIFDDATQSHEIQATPLAPSRAAESQAGNFRHRRLGLGVRLADDIQQGLKVPSKRVSPEYRGASKSRVRLIRQRRVLSTISLHEFEKAKLRDDFEIYSRPMRHAIQRYDFYAALDRGALGIIKYIAKRILRRN